MGLTVGDNTETMKNTIITTFTKFPNMKCVYFDCNNPMVETMQTEVSMVASWVEIGLLDSKEMNREPLEIVFDFRASDDSDPPSISIKDLEIEAIAKRMINALDVSNLKDFRFTYYIPQDIDDPSYRQEIVEKFNSTHFAETANEIDDYFRITISNKDCKIIGHEKMLL